MAADTLLLELGAEELPPTALEALSDAFAAGIEKGLQEAEVPFQSVTAYATPRRLAVQVSGLADKQPDREVERRGPALAAAFKDGVPTKAAEGFARSCGVSVDELIHLETDKGTWLGFQEQQQGERVQALLPEMIRKTLQSLPVPKNMRWGASRVEFSRPVHWLVALYGKQVIAAEALGLQASRTTYGHRFHAPDAIQLEHADDYLAALENAYVLADRQQRRERIREQVLAEAEVQEANAVIDEDLLVEVSGLVEWPVALTGSFDERFLDVPAECLISSMKANQKYFHLLDDHGKLKPLFITISNIESQDLIRSLPAMRRSSVLASRMLRSSTIPTAKKRWHRAFLSWKASCFSSSSARWQTRHAAARPLLPSSPSASRGCRPRSACRGTGQMRPGH